MAQPTKKSCKATDDETIEFCLKGLRRVGLRLEESKSDFKQTCSTYFGLVINFSLLVLAHIYFIVGDVQFETFPPKFEGAVVLYQLYLKVAILWFYKKEIASLLSDVQYFLRVEDELPEEYRKKLFWLIDLPKRAFKIYQIVLAVNAFFFAMKPYYAQGELPFDCLIPASWRNYVYGVELLSIIYDFHVVVGFECLFAALGIKAILQLKILKYKMTILDFNNHDDIRTIVVHHNFIIEFIKKLRYVYSSLFLCHIAITTLTICMEFYLITEGSQSLGYSLKNIVFCSTLTIQFSFYCAPASLICDEAGEIGDAIYNSKWYEYGPEVRVYVIFIMARSSQVLAFTAGGFHDVSWMTFTYVFKTSISYFTMMSTMRDNKEI